MDLRSKETIISLAATLFFHLFLLILFLFSRVHWNPKLQTFTEISFQSGENLPTQSFQSSQKALDRAIEEQSSDKIQLPQRRMLEPEQVAITVEKNKMSAEDKMGLPDQEKNLHPWEKQSFKAKSDFSEKEIPITGEKFSLEDKSLPSSQPLSLPDESSRMPYTIEGEASHRTVVYKILPRYPENLQKTATVRIQFTVLADGQIGEMIPLIKGDAELERITLNALKQWRFNPLPSNQPQKTEIGIITFRYLLK